MELNILMYEYHQVLYYPSPTGNWYIDNWGEMYVEIHHGVINILVCETDFFMVQNNSGN